MSRTRLLFAVLAAALVSGPAGAQDAKSDAEALFAAGRELVAAGRVAEGCEKLSASQRLDPALGTLLNLAECHLQLGAATTAWREFKSAAALARQKGDEPRRLLAEQRAAEVEPRLPRLRIRVPDGLRLSGLRLSRDGASLPLAALDVALPVDPGPHSVRVEAPGRAPQSRRVLVPAAPGVTTVLLVLKPTPAHTRRVMVAPSPVWRVTTFTALGLSAVAMGAGTALAVRAVERYGVAESGCTAPPLGCSQSAVELARTAGADADGATVAFVLSGLFASMGVVTWALTAKPVEVVVAPNQVALRGSF